ncbi:MAG: DUF3822 family protein [Muribaculaceae bacterium]|nr:DUF3822 family protein [Muribaculaceae bacterium]
MASHEPLTKDLVAKPQLWRLAMRVGQQAVDVAINTPLEDHALIYRHFDLEPGMEPLAAFEDLIYDNPLLLSDFDKVDILIDTPRFTLVPSEVRSDDVRADIVQAIWPDPALTTLAQDLPTGDTLLMAADSGLVSFIRRTFLEGRIHHPIGVLATYFSARSGQGNASKLFCRLRPGAVDMVGMAQGRLAVATSAEAPTPDDMAYFILATAQTCGLSLDADELCLYGDADLREQVAPLLRPLARYVMPVIFPSEIFKAGKDALQAPFELMILPLCE